MKRSPGLAWSAPRLPATLLSMLLAAFTGVLEARGLEDRLSALDNSGVRSFAAKALSAGELNEAVAGFAELAGRNPRDPSAQTLLGLTYHCSAAQDPERLDLARAGYELALNQQPGNFWAAALAGRAAYERGDYDEASNRYAQAVLARPGEGRVLLALATSAYMSGDIELAAAAADQAVRLTEGSDSYADSLRLAVLANTAGGYAPQAHAQLLTLSSQDAVAADDIGSRAHEIARTNAVDIVPASTPTPEVPIAAPEQITVDVAIVLAQRTKRDRIGLNLMDGLTLNYGYGRSYQESRNKTAGATSAYSAQRSITRAITVPELNYNLNLFNRTGQYYSVVARPSLTAYQGETSEFFIGRTLKVAVAGVNFSSLEEIDIGIELKVTPLEITTDDARVRVETTRSFMTEDAAGTFREGISTFRQKVAATTKVGFGETLILSGLSESVDDSTYSKTPLMGDLPLIGSAFNERSKQSRRDSAIVLVTPALPGRLPGRAQNRPENVGRLVRLWTEVVDPATNATDIGARLSRMRLFTRARPGDAPLVWPSPREQSTEALQELLLPAYD